MLGEGVVAGPPLDGKTDELLLLEEADWVLAAQRREAPLAFFHRAAPEQRIGKVDFVQGEAEVGLHHGLLRGW